MGAVADHACHRFCLAFIAYRTAKAAAGQVWHCRILQSLMGLQDFSESTPQYEGRKTLGLTSPSGVLPIANE